MSAARLWTPTAESIAESNIGRFTAWLGRRGIGPFDSYDELWRWSVTDIAGFWSAIADYFEIATSAPYATIVDSETMPGAQWLAGATLNYAEHILRDRVEGTAIIATGTPAGVGVAMKPPRCLNPGSTVRIEIDKLGVLENPVVAQP